MYAVAWWRQRGCGNSGNRSFCAAPDCCVQAAGDVSGPYDPINDPCNGDPFYYGRWLLCIGAGATLLFVSFNGLMHEWDGELAHIKLPARTAIRASCVVVMCLVPLAGKGARARFAFVSLVTFSQPWHHCSIWALVRVVLGVLSCALTRPRSRGAVWAVCDNRTRAQGRCDTRAKGTWQPSQLSSSADAYPRRRCATSPDWAYNRSR